jgi:hypothetical protein
MVQQNQDEMFLGRPAIIVSGTISTSPPFPTGYFRPVAEVGLNKRVWTRLGTDSGTR